MMDDEMKQAIRAMFADGRRHLGEALRVERERMEAAELRSYGETDMKVTQGLFDDQLHLRLVLVLTALDELGGEASLEALGGRLYPPGVARSSFDELEVLVGELVRREKVTREGELVRRVR